MTSHGEDEGLMSESEGQFLCWGCGEFGQHCHGQKKEIGFNRGLVEKFSRQPGSRVKLVACGSSHTVVVTNSNEVFVWGNGNSGQLGCNNTETYWEPQQIQLYTIQTTAPDISGVACGGRHTMIWLNNGNVFAFGNNFHAQLGYDFREKNYKENQTDTFWGTETEEADSNVTQPQLLKFLTYRPVVQVACGEKHTVFRFKDGHIACVGSNSHGQIGSDNKEDATVPKFLEEFHQPIIDIAAGSHHTLAITADGEVYNWGYGKACGSKTEDVLSPTRQHTHTKNITRARAGGTHSMVLSSNGSVYTWGTGSDGQLGHGDHLKFLPRPRRVKDKNLANNVVHIDCGETFSAAIKENGCLYMWGKNSHTISAGKPTSLRVFRPTCINRKAIGPIRQVYCGSWHAAALTGSPPPLVRNGEESEPSSEGEDDELLQLNGHDSPEEVEEENNKLETMLNGKSIHSSTASETDEEIHGTREGHSGISRDKTKVSLAEFYAPTPDPKADLRSPSPEFFIEDKAAVHQIPPEWTKDRQAQEEEDNSDGNKGVTLVVQLPSHGVSHYVDAATSPMTVTTSSTQSSSIHSRVPSPLPEIPVQEVKPVQVMQRPREIPKLDKIVKTKDRGDTIKIERRKHVYPTQSMEVVQVSKTSADSFTLPRETSSLTKKHVDFAEMEEARLFGPIRSPDKMSLSRLSDTRNRSPTKSHSSRATDSAMSSKTDFRFMESPLFRHSRVSNGSSRKPWNSNEPEEEKFPRPRVPKHPPKMKLPSTRPTDTNFGLQISRSKTVVGPLVNDRNDVLNTTNQMKRYASMHNPQSTGGKSSVEKPWFNQQRQVSIPGGHHSDIPAEGLGKLCVDGQLNSATKLSFSSGSTWKERSDLDRLQSLAHRKGIAAGIVKMYLENKDNLEKPWYPNILDDVTQNQNQSDVKYKGEVLTVQPLLKSKSGQDDSVENLDNGEIDKSQYRTKIKEFNRRDLRTKRVARNAEITDITGATLSINGISDSHAS